MRLPARTFGRTDSSVTLTDVFALQDEVTAAVVSAIQPKLLQTEIAMATRRRPENLTAYDFYLRAVPQYYLTTREGVVEAIRLSHRALELDPRFGLVAALAGICHAENVLWGYAVDPQFERKEAGSSLGFERRRS
jgi:adenylate cyclase